MGRKDKPLTEAQILQECRIKASECGAVMFRNNVGFGLMIRHNSSGIRRKIIAACVALAAKMGGTAYEVKFGLCEGSHDLIGLFPLVVTQEMVGKTIAQFTTIEAKTEIGKLTPEQIKFFEFVNSHGGNAMVIRNPLDIYDKIKQPYSPDTQ